MPFLKSCKLLCCVVLPFSLLARKANAEATWIEVTSPHFRVLTDGSVQQGRDVAADFEQLRHVFALQFKDEAMGAGGP